MQGDLELPSLLSCEPPGPTAVGAPRNGPPPFSFLPMKSSLLPALLAGLALLPFVGCNKHDQAEIKTGVQNAYADTKAAFAKTWDKIRNYTYEKRADFDLEAKAAAERMDAQITELRTNYSEAKASASRKAAMEELKNSQADYREKMRALGTASADTWDSAKQNVILAWDKLQASYYKARTN